MDEWREYQTKNRRMTAIRWNRYILPMLPEASGTRFLDLGCNAGEHCDRAKALGFQTIGVDYLPFPGVVKCDLNSYNIPATHVSLLSLVLHWQQAEEVEMLVEKLRNRSVYVIVVGRHRRSEKHLSDSTLEHIRKVFRLWKELKVIQGKNLYSILFQSNRIYLADTESLFLRKLWRSKAFTDSFSRFAGKVLSGKNFEVEKSRYYKYMDAIAMGTKAIRSIRVINRIKEEGINEPVKVCKGRVLDGAHRIVLARVLGIKKIVCEETSLG